LTTRRAPARHFARTSAGSHIPRRRWPRRMLLVANILVAVSLIGVGSAYGYVRYRINEIQTFNAPHLSETTRGAGQPVGAPENILLIGNETRAGLNPSEQAAMGSASIYSGSLSDVIMVLHLDPNTRQASIISIPRDLFAPMPSGSPVGPWQKIDAALNDGANGPDNLINAIQSDFGIPINHFVELNFDGFENTVNALGGIRLDFPDRLFDQYSNLNIQQTGCVYLTGSQALALVRSRHLQYAPPNDAQPPQYWPYDPESDLARIVRDHVFLRVLFSTAVSDGLRNPIKLNNFIGAVVNQITMDPGLKNQLLNLAGEFGGINPTDIPETTLPVTTVSNYYYGGYAMGDVDFPVQPDDDQTIRAWDSAALPAPANPSAVNVLNDVGTASLAGTTSTELTALGLPAGTTGDGTVSGSPEETLVDYAPGSLAQAVAVIDHLSGAVMLNPDPKIAPGTVTVEAGTTFAVTTPAPAPPTAPTTSTTSAASSTTATTAPPTVGGQAPSASADNLTPWDPRPCPS
jgi:LCP family protein required for cell wall assembly